MLKIFKNLLYSIAIRIGFALNYADELMFGYNNPEFSEKDKKNQRHRNRNNILESFYAGKEDEKFTQDYYEILKKSDEFMRAATPFKMAAAADRHGMSYGHEDQYGRKHEHYGFFDENHKNAGKSMEEVIASEYENRKTNDDDFVLSQIINNTPIEVGLMGSSKIVDCVDDSEFVLKNMLTRSKQFEFPIKCLRPIEVLNKIEQLTESLHIKTVGSNLLRLEFFIPAKYRTYLIEEDKLIFKQIINIDSVFIKDLYGKLTGYSIESYIKRTTLTVIVKGEEQVTYDVIKFSAKEIHEA